MMCDNLTAAKSPSTMVLVQVTEKVRLKGFIKVVVRLNTQLWLLDMEHSACAHRNMCACACASI